MVANPDHRNFGIWRVLPDLRALFNNPFYLAGDMNEAVEREKGVVIGEITERNYGSEMARTRQQTMFAPGNPFLTDVGGKEADIRSFTPMDVYQVAHRLFQPRGLLISAFAEGPTPLCTPVFDEVERLFENYQDPKIDSNGVDLALFDGINPQIFPGSIHHLDFGNNEMYKLLLLWKTPLNKSLPMDFALREYAQVVKEKLHAYVRRGGLGYTSGVHLMDLHSQRLLMLDLTVPSTSIDENGIFHFLIPDLYSRVLSAVSTDEVQTHVDKRHDERQATPKEITKTFSDIVSQYRHNHRLVDINQMDENEAIGLDTDLIMEYQDHFQTVSPSVILTSL